MNGMKLSDFPNHEEALSVADQLIAQSMHEFGHQLAVVSYGSVLTDKYFYIQSDGRTREWCKDRVKELSKAGAPKTAKALADGGVCPELLDTGKEAEVVGAAAAPLEEVQACADVARSFFRAKLG